MKIQPFQTNYSSYISNQYLNFSKSNFVCTKPLKFDTVSFSGRKDKIVADQKMTALANKLLDEKNLKEDQLVWIKAEKEQVPFVEKLMVESYKRKSGRVFVDIKEPKMDALKKKYLKAPDFEFIQKKENYLKENNAIIFDFDGKNNPYAMAKMTKPEQKEIDKTIIADIPERVEKKLAKTFNEKEIFKDLLNIKKGQPISIYAQRGHESNVLRLAEYAYKNGSGPINVEYVEPNHLLENEAYKYAKDEVLTTVHQPTIDKFDEMYKRQSARLTINAEIPNLDKDVDEMKVYHEKLALYNAKSSLQQKYPPSQWNMYYLPTLEYAKYAYPEIKNPVKALEKAADDAIKINRSGNIKEHLTNLAEVYDKLNKYKFDKIHFYSVDPITKELDGKTDLYVGLTEKSRFKNSIFKLNDGTEFNANTPTEEVFTAPDNTRTEGTVYSTLPLTLDNQIVNGMRFDFENGKIKNVTADKNEELLKSYIDYYDGADRLGEVGLVGNSPIFAAGRTFGMTLLDENAVSHLAIGQAFPDCIEGANEIENSDNLKNYLDANNINQSQLHVDFMVGGPNVMIDGIKKDGECINIIKDNKFSI